MSNGDERREEGIIELPDALQVQIDRAIAARVDSRLGQLEGAPRARRGNWSAVVLNISLAAFGFMTSGITATYVHGPEAVIALATEWAAIAAIGVTYTRAWAGSRHAAIGRGQATPLVQPQPPPAMRAAPRPTPIATAAPAPASDLLDRLPLDVRVKVEQIRSKAELLLRHQDRFPIGSRHLYVLRRIQAEYLPSTVNVYLALSGDDRPVTPDGRTALRVLRDQLRVLDGKLDEIAEDLQRENADRLLANERFLEEHFGRPPQADPDLHLR